MISTITKTFQPIELGAVATPACPWSARLESSFFATGLPAAARPGATREHDDSLDSGLFVDHPRTVAPTFLGRPPV